MGRPPPLPPGSLKIRLPRKAETEGSPDFSPVKLKNVPQTWLKGQSTGVFIKCFLAVKRQNRKIRPGQVSGTFLGAGPPSRAQSCRASLHLCRILTPPWEVGVDLLVGGSGLPLRKLLPFQAQPNCGSFVHSVLGRSSRFGDLPWETRANIVSQCPAL